MTVLFLRYRCSALIPTDTFSDRHVQDSRIDGYAINQWYLSHDARPWGGALKTRAAEDNTAKRCTDACILRSAQFSGRNNYFPLWLLSFFERL